MVAAAANISVRHEIGDGARSLTGDKIIAVTSSLDNCIVLLEGNGEEFCIVTLNVGNLRQAMPMVKQSLSDAVGIDEEHITIFVSHNHCDVELNTMPDDGTDPELTPAGERLVRALASAARGLRTAMRPVTVRYGLGECRGISYLRKGRRHDGTTYFMREEDRIELGVDYSGSVDNDAPVISLIDDEGTPVCHIVSFTAHPVTAYHPEHPIVAGEYCQTATRYLADWTGGTPVAFIQGCAGDTNSKRFLTLDEPTQKVFDATIFGTQLGAAFSHAVGAHESQSDTLGFERRIVNLPFDAPPSLEETRAKLEEIDDFLVRCARGDENTLSCAGLNPSRTMSPRYRSGLLAPVRKWYAWVEGLHRGEGEAMQGADIDVVALRIGDAAITGLSCEPFSTIGLSIKANSPAKLTMTGGYFDRLERGYVPDGKNHRDLDYVSSFYRYRIGMLPFADPAGDRLAAEAVESLNRLFAL